MKVRYPSPNRGDFLRRPADRYHPRLDQFRGYRPNVGLTISNPCRLRGTPRESTGAAEAGITIRYAFRVRGSSNDALLVARQAGLGGDRVRHTTISGRFRDQAALCGTLARLRLLGLEVMDVRELPCVRRPGHVESDGDAGSPPA